MFMLVLILKAIVEVALFGYAGQAILYILAGNRRHNNFIYQTLRLLTRPMEKAVRFISPRIILDQHIPLATFFLMTAIWLMLIILKAQMVLQAQQG